MLAHFIEASVMFQNADIFKLYGIIFGTLGAICLYNYISDCKKYDKDEF